MEDDLIAIFELTVQEDQVKLVLEKHYRLVKALHYASDYRYRTREPLANQLQTT